MEKFMMTSRNFNHMDEANEEVRFDLEVQERVVEVIKEVEVVKEVEVIKEVVKEIIKEVEVEKEVIKEV